MLYLALSCLQTRPMAEAFLDLAALQPDGIQLTPGCAPTPDFKELVDRGSIKTTLHHGFSWTEYKQDVWSFTGERKIPPGARSVHPPRQESNLCFSTDWWLADIAKVHADLVYETMYPPYILGHPHDILDAMAMGLPLAIDVSHLNIQRCQLGVNGGVIQEILGYSNIKEIHVSHNNGALDSHKPLEQGTYLLDWVKEKEKTGALVILESYFHKMTQDDRKRQLDLVRS